ncbi:MAG: hypothetical protein M1826_003552 [Phylliscum demangeonii]|nr:MAG: hypothetical protein M1826_003552 [Phylliscum demangeonii]
MEQSAVSARRQPRASSEDCPPLHDPLQTLHDAEVYLILEYLSTEDIVCASAVCRQWKAHIEGFISTTAMRRSFPWAWDKHKHHLPLDPVELGREYRRQAKFSVENLFSTKAAWQGTMRLSRSCTTTSLIPSLTQTRIKFIGLATTLDLLFIRVVPEEHHPADQYVVAHDAPLRDRRHECTDLVYSIPDDRLVWSKRRTNDERRELSVEVGRHAYHHHIARYPSNANFFHLTFFAEDLATGEEIYCRHYRDVYKCSLLVMETQDLIGVHQVDLITIRAGTTGDIIRVIKPVGANFMIWGIASSDNLVSCHRGNLPFHRHTFLDFYRLRGDEPGGRYTLELLHQRHTCNLFNVSPHLHGVFRRNLRGFLLLHEVRRTVRDRETWKISLSREEAAPTCPCVEDLQETFADEMHSPFPAGLLAPPEGGWINYATELSGHITLPPTSNPTSAANTKKAEEKSETKQNRPLRRPFTSDREMSGYLPDEDYMVLYIFRTLGVFDFHLLSFRADW